MNEKGGKKGGAFTMNAIFKFSLILLVFNLTCISANGSTEVPSEVALAVSSDELSASDMLCCIPQL